MKALSIQEPWAWAILNGKDVENRTWPTRFRGRFLIHVGAAFDWSGYQWLLDNRETLGLPELPAPPFGRHGNRYRNPGGFQLGGVVAEAVITDCVTNMDSRWFFGPHGFVLAGAKRVPFRPMRGYLNFFEVDP